MNTATELEKTSAPEVPQPKTKRTPAKKAKPAKKAARAGKPAIKLKTDRANKKAEVPFNAASGSGPGGVAALWQARRGWPKTLDVH